MKTIIADLTNAYSGTETNLLASLATAYSTDLQNIIVLCKPYQRATVGSQFPHVRTINALHYGQVVSFVKREFLEGFLANSGDGDDRLVVVTLHPAVFDLQMYVPETLRPRVEFIRWAQLLPPRNLGQVGRQHAHQALANLMSENEVFSAVERALVRARASDRASALRMSDIRMHLEVEEPRFRKTHPGANVHGVIGAAIELCEKRGLLAIDRTMDRINYFLWLKAKSEVTGGGNGHAVQPVEPTSTESPEHEGSTNAARVAIPVMPGDTTTRAEANAAAVKAERQSRSDQFVDSLRKQGLGPFSRLRKALYDALKEVVDGGDKSLIAVLSATIELTKSRIPDQPEEKPIPWRKVREFLREMIGRRAVLLSSDGPIAQSFQSLSKPVVGLADSWRLDLDGELIVALVRDGMNVHLADLQFIAGALFNDRSEETEAQAAEVIEFLLKTGRLEENADHYLHEPQRIETTTRMLTA